ncbi:MAG TPA: DUF58 domain-containing protein [Rectinemataceae bacterium]|nr:DUF58 domain-containing protein [Rectinemataceae bacterium]
MSLPRVAALAAALLMVTAGLATAQSSWFVAALPLAAWACLGFFVELPAPGLEARRILSSSFAPADSTVEVRLVVLNRGRRIDRLVLRDEPPPALEVASGSPVWEGSLESGACAEFGYRLVVRRGLFDFDELQARIEEPFAAIVRAEKLPCPARLVVPPRSRATAGPLLAAHAVRPFGGQSRARRPGGGTDFSGTRDYSPGDPLRSVSWRAEALWDSLVVNVFEEDRALDVGLILDARAEAYDRTRLFEAAVSAAATLADGLLAGGNRVAFLSYGSIVEWTPPGAGREHRVALRVAAARAALGDHAAFDRFDNLPIRLFPPRSAVLLVSPLLRGDLLALRSVKALGYGLTVLQPQARSPEADRDDAARLAGRMLALEADILVARLRSARIEVIPWDVETSLSRSIGLARLRR